MTLTEAYNNIGVTKAEYIKAEMTYLNKKDEFDKACKEYRELLKTAKPETAKEAQLVADYKGQLIDRALETGNADKIQEARDNFTDAVFTQRILELTEKGGQPNMEEMNRLIKARRQLAKERKTRE